MREKFSALLQWTPVTVVLTYLVLGCLWILLSDEILNFLVDNSDTRKSLQTYKGWFYVLLTAAMLYALTRASDERAREIEAARSASSRRYDELVENANDGIFTLDADGNFTVVNRAIEKITGFRRDESLKKNFADLLAPESRHYLKRLLDPQDTQNPTFVSEVKIVRKDGEAAFLEISSRPLNSPHNGQLVIENIARDVTQRRAMEEALRESKLRYQTLIEAANEGILTVDAEFNVIFANPKICAMTGYQADEILGKSLFELIGTDLQEQYKNGFPTSREEMLQPMDAQFTRSDGKRIWLLISSNPIIYNDKFHGVLFMATDITARKNAEESLQKSEERLRKLYRIISDSNLDYGEKINRLLMLGMQEFGVETALLAETRDNIYRVVRTLSPDNRVFAGFTCPLNEAFCEEVMRTNEVLAIENLGVSHWRNHPAYTRFGAEVYFGVPVSSSGKNYGTLCFISKTPRATAFSSGDQEFLRLMSQWVSAEITRQAAEEALHRSEEQLAQAQKLESVGQLAGGIAHDFNNMLTAINGYSELLLRQMDELSPLRRSIVEIKKAGERSARLTQQLLAFSRQQILKPTTLNINQTVSEVISLLERLIGEDVLLIVDLGVDVKKVEVDAGQLSQVIVNLAVNARDAMPKGGTIKIETKNVAFDAESAAAFEGKPGEYVMISVSDTGCGMNEETRRRIFEPFYTTKEVGKGTGLGLATAYGFIKQSNGYITVESRPGSGTTFNIILPRGADLSEEQMEETAFEESRRGAETILLVEDEELVRSFGREVLESGGYRVIEAASGADALAVCADADLHIDLLLTDVVMPQMNGHELWERITARRPRIKVLFTSGYTDDMVVRRGIKNDETNYLQKPFLVNEILHKVREVLDEDDFLNRKA